MGLCRDPVHGLWRIALRRSVRFHDVESRAFCTPGQKMLLRKSCPTGSGPTHKQPSFAWHLRRAGISCASPRKAAAMSGFVSKPAIVTTSVVATHPDLQQMLTALSGCKRVAVDCEVLAKHAVHAVSGCPQQSLAVSGSPLAANSSSPCCRQATPHLMNGQENTCML